MKIILNEAEPSMHPTSAELARTVLYRLGLEPRKKGSTDKMYNVLLELYEKVKYANKEKKPEHAVMTVEEMAIHAGITRQTMYEYLKRWLNIRFLVKTSYIKDGKVIIGYKLNGNTLEQAFEKAAQQIRNHLETTQKYVRELQKIIKNEKIRKSVKKTVERPVAEPVEEEKEADLQLE